MKRLNLPGRLAEAHKRDAGRRGMSLGPKAITWILDNILQGRVIVELGSGLGTQILSNAYIIYSIEHNTEFLNICDCSTYIYAPLQDDKWYDPRPIVACLPTDYDLLIVDGPKWRTPLIDHLYLFRSDIPWLIDDVNDPVNLALAQRIASENDREITIHDAGTARAKQFAIIGPERETT